MLLHLACILLLALAAEAVASQVRLSDEAHLLASKVTSWTRKEHGGQKWMDSKEHLKRQRWVTKVSRWCCKWGNKLGCPSDLLLAILIRESSLDPAAQGGKGEVGMCQTSLSNYRRDCRVLGLKVKLGDPETQVAVGCWELRACLKRSATIHQAICRYNGGGKKARDYGRDVLAIWKGIAHEPI